MIWWRLQLWGPFLFIIFPPQKMRSHHQIVGVIIVAIVVEIVVIRPGELAAEGEAKEALWEVGGC